MGGPGSGNRWRSNARLTTDEYRALDVRALARAGALRPGVWTWQWSRNGHVSSSIRVLAEKDRLVLIYKYRIGSEAWQDERYPVTIQRTACHRGGTRPWFICPASGCGRRVALLYGGQIFACRHCHRLAYASTREREAERAVRRAERVRARLGWESGMLNGRGSKPRWMRWRTFSELTQEYDRLVENSVRALQGELTLLVGGRQSG